MWWSAPLAGAEHALLDDADRARCAALRLPADRARFATGRVLARRALGAELGVGPEQIVLRTRCPRCGGPHGKPALCEPAAAIEFSIAHAGERVVVATSREGAVGVDVERIRPHEGLAAEVLTVHERAALDTLPEGERDAAFIRTWTRKEAVLKATGDGLLEAMADLRVTAPDEPPAVLAWPGEPRAVRMLDLDAGEGYRACVAVLVGRPVVQARRNSNSSSGPPTIAVTRPDGSS